jgi:transposase
MHCRRYQKTLNRHQAMLLPLLVEEFVSENNSVRAIDAYVNTLDIQGLGVNYA